MLRVAVVLLFGAVFGWLAGAESVEFAGFQVFTLCAMIAFGIQLVAFIPAYLLQTERFYDLTGSITYLSVVTFAGVLGGPQDERGYLLAICVVVWALRLGSFLFRRILQDKKDGRFDDIKPVISRFMLAWVLQGLWVTLTAGAALAALAGATKVPMGTLGYIGFAIWLAGFAIEVVSDQQKRAFRREHGSEAFISTGLWSYSRHPNYVGEITLWAGVALLAFPALQGWQLLTLISPVFVYWLLSRVSGVTMLEERADAKWGGRGDYERYKAETPVLFPTPWG